MTDKSAFFGACALALAMGEAGGALEWMWKAFSRDGRGGVGGLPMKVTLWWGKMAVVGGGADRKTGRGTALGVFWCNRVILGVLEPF